MRSRFLAAVLGFAVSALALAQCGGNGTTERDGDSRATTAPDGDWPMYRHDLAATGHSPLAELTPSNVASLTRVWTYALASRSAEADGRGPSSQATPIVVAGVMYLPAADAVVALVPETGREIWRQEVPDGAPSRRGVAYWPGDDTTPARIIVTAGERLLALDAATGATVESFGQGGAQDMGVPYNSVPLVYDDVVVVGANTPRGAPGGIGNARAFSARTGEKIWEFSSVPQPGEPGHDTWDGDSWRDRLGVNAWPFYFSMDEERALVYLPLASPIPADYGGDRPGDNLYGNSVVAVDIETGAYRWHFQTIRHDLWDADPPAPPVLFDVPREGGTIPALGVTTKSGYLYILNRETGEPIYGIEDIPVAASDVPGERAAATQPVPVKPRGLSRVSFEPADLVTAEDTSPAHAAACRELVDSLGDLYNAGPFTPWVYREPGAPPRTTISFPGGVGGANWGGPAFDPATGYVLVATQDLGLLGWMEPAPDGAPVPYVKRAPRPSSFTVRIDEVTLPCQKPPWGRLTAVDVSTGDIAWQETLGITDQLPDGRRATGRPIRAGGITTGGGVLFVAGTDDSRLRAFETANGREVWTGRLDQPGNANPITYRGGDGRQYVAIVATDTLVVFGLP
jgi:quinoprotein glucose dehydrogenase